MLIESVRKTIMSHRLFRDRDEILVGVSGGHDSVTLFHILKEISKDTGYKLYIAHVNHGVRGVESDGDEEYVRDMASANGVPFYSKKVDMNLYAKERGLSAEEAGREIRYSFFREILKKEMVGGKIAVAHNRNDQAETVLMRVMRGTGVDGLKGMDFVNGDIVRPLLNVPRADIEKYCEERGLEPRIDRTNFENIYARNKVRLELIPYIEKNFNQNLIDTVCRMSDIIRKDAEYLERVSEKEYRDIALCEKHNIVSLDNEKFKKLDMAIRYRVGRIAISKVLGNLEGLEEKHVRILSEFSEMSKTGKSIDLVRGLVAKLSYDKLSIEKSEKKSGIRYNYKMEIGKPLQIKEIGATIKSSLTDVDSVELGLKERYTKHFDYDEVSEDISIRNRLPGDKVHLLGMSGRKKLKDYYIDEKIPKDERDHIPLVEIDGEIVWIIGYRTSDKAKITSKTKTVLTIEYLKDKES